ncbi:MAG TPA: hypothetical protein VED16_00345 [Candidatus Acidoferrum sp.]|nr:hypothetical protein [Candidatus Acidoferrum sp.]
MRSLFSGIDNSAFTIGINFKGIKKLSGCKYHRILSVPLGTSNLEYETCLLAGGDAMVHREQCSACTIVELEKSFDCTHMKPAKIFTSGGKSNELTECTKSGEILNEGRDKCKHCAKKEEVSA